MQDICVFSSSSEHSNWLDVFQHLVDNYGLEFPQILDSGKHGRWALEARGNLDKDQISAIRATGQLDINCISSEERRKKLLIADMDSTIIRQESLDHLADIAGIGDEIAKITAAAMAGALDFEQALDKRVGMLAGSPAHLLDQVIAETKITSGAAELVGTMRAHGAECYLVSGGFTFLTGPISEQLGFHGHNANQLNILDGALSGTVEKPILDRDAKLTRLNSLCDALGINLSDAATVGDGANDLAMLEAAGLGVAFEGKPLLREAIDIQLNHTDLAGLLYLQGFHGSEFQTFQHA